MSAYGNSVIKRLSADQAAELDARLLAIASDEKPTSVRGMYYMAMGAGLIDKDAHGKRHNYMRVQRRLLQLRREGTLPYSWITDGSRTIYGYDRFADGDDFSAYAANIYRKDYWLESPVRVEVWVEKDAMAGKLKPVVRDEYGLDLYVSRGFASETYLQEAAAHVRSDGRPVYVYLLTDFDASGMGIAETVEERLTEMARPVDVFVERIAATPEQVEEYGLITQPVTRSDTRARRFVQRFGTFANMLSEGIPWAKDLARYIERISEDSLAWSQSDKGRKQMREFFESAADLAPKVARAVGKLASGLMRVSKDKDTQTFLKDFVVSFGHLGESAGKINEFVDTLGRMARWLNKLYGFKKGEGPFSKGFFALPNFNWKTTWVYRFVQYVLGLRARVKPGWDRLWQDVADWLGKKMAGMSTTLSNWKDRAVGWVSSLPGAIGNVWKNRVWQPMATFVSEKADGISQTLGNWKGRAVSWAGSLPGAIAKPFNAVFQGMASFVIKKKDGILGTMGNLVTGVKELWGELSQFVHDTLERFGINLPGSSSAEKKRGTSGLGNNQQGSPATQDYAEGGRVKARPGGLYRVAEAGQDEWVINPNSPGYLRHLRGAAAEGGYGIHRAPESAGERTHRRAQMRGYGRQEGFGPTMYTLIPELRRVAESVANKFGTPWNTYSNHPPGYAQPYYRERSVDWWGGGGRGDPIGSIWTSVASEARRLLGSNLNWMLTPSNDPAGHSDHVHVTAFASGGASGAGGGVSASYPNPKQAAFELAWKNTAQRAIDGFASSMQGGFVLRQAAAGLTTQAGKAIYSAIDAKIPDMIGGAPVTGYADGGWVQGRLGQPVPAVLHGGEFVLPASAFSKRSTNVVSSTGGSRDSANLEAMRREMEAMRRELARNIGEEVREGMKHNIERGRKTQSSLMRGFDRGSLRREMGGPALARAR